jgi:hypothetical protein
MGIIAYILLSGDAPFKGNNRIEIQNEIKTKAITYSHPAWLNISDEAKDFIN